MVGEDSHGQQKWVYLPPGPARDEWKQCKVAKYALGLEVGAPKLKTTKTPMDAARNGFSFYKQLQSSDGHFATEYGGGCHLCGQSWKGHALMRAGPLFLIPGLVIAMHVVGEPFTAEQSVELRRYILNKRRDGGWGL